MPNPPRISLAQRLGYAIKAGRMVFSGWGGSTTTPFGATGYPWPGFMPGSLTDWQALAGDLWRNEVVSICLGWIADNYCQPEFQVTRQKGSVWEPVPDHPLTKLLANPNPAYGASALWQAVVTSEAVSGNAYLFKARPAEGWGQPLELWYVPHWQVFPQWDKAGRSFIDHYLYRVPGKADERLDVGDVVHFRRGLSLYNQRSGEAPLGPLLREIVSDTEATAYVAAILANSGVPNVAISADGAGVIIPDDEAEKLQRSFSQKFGGENRGRALVCTRPMKVEPFQWSPEELALDKLPMRAEARLCAALRVPPMVVGLNVGDQQRTYCLPAEARVWTTAGAKPIVDVQAGDTVWSVVDGTLQPRRVLRSGKTGRKRLYEVRTKNRTLKATDNHPMLVRVPGSRTEGSNDERRVRYGWKPVGELNVHDHVVQPKWLPDQEGTTLPNGEEATAEMMQFLGALIGDGCIVLRPNGGRFEMAMPESDRCGARYREMAAALFTQHGGGAVAVQERPRSFTCCGTAAARELVAWGISGTAKKKRIPGWVYQTSRPLRLAFLAGLVDSDGSIDARGALSFTFCNEALTHDIRDLLVSCGIQCTNVYHDTQSGASLPNPCRQLFYDLWRFTASSAVQVAEIPFVDPLYRLRVEANPERYRSHGFDSHKTGLAEELGFYEVKSIREMGVAAVYDIEVEGGHCFIADGVVVHNSNMGEARQMAYEDCLMPLQARHAETLQQFLLPDLGDADKERCRYDYENVRALQEDENDKSTRAIAQFQAGIITRAQALAKVGMESTPEDEVYFLPSSGQLLHADHAGASAVRDRADQQAQMRDAALEGLQSGAESQGDRIAAVSHAPALNGKRTASAG